MTAAAPDRALLGARDPLARWRRRPEARWLGTCVVVDVLMLGAAAVVTELASAAAGAPQIGLGWLGLFSLLVLALFRLLGMYRSRLRLEFLDGVRTIVVATAVAAMALITLRALIADDPQAVGQEIRHWLFACVYLTAGRAGLVLAENRGRTRGEGKRPTLIVGAGRVGQAVAQRLRDDPGVGLLPIGFLDKEPLENGSSPPLPVLGASWDLDRVLAEHQVEHVIVTFSTAPASVLLGIVSRCQELGVSVSQTPRLFESMTDRASIERLGALPLLSADAPKLGGVGFVLKHAVDRLVAALLLVATLPVTVTAATVILVSMGRPVLFRQRRTGLDGRQFDIFKLRTMEHPREEHQAAVTREWPADIPPGGAERDSDRITRLGRVLRRASIDELPQLINVLQGAMSLVGPRPERPEFVELFRNDVYRYKDRHRVKSGITGLAQVDEIGRGRASVTRRAELDNYYIENWSSWLDLKILLWTVVAVARRRPLTIKAETVAFPWVVQTPEESIGDRAGRP